MEERIYEFNQSTFRVVFGSILKSRAQVIVSSDDCYLSEGGGISRVIAMAGGEKVMYECRKMAPVRLGDVAVTTAGRLPQKYIFHCITLSDNESDRASLFESLDDYHRYIIGRSVDKCFRLMAALDLSSIAFPCIGAGAAGIPPETFASIMADRVVHHMSRSNKEYQIELYLYDHLNRWEPIDYLPVFETIAVGAALCKVNLERYRNDEEEEEEVAEERASTLPDALSDTEEMTHQVFISYSRKDPETAVQRVQSLLGDHGYSYWIDKDGMLSHDSFKGVLRDAIKASSVVLFLSSVHSNASKYVAKEIGLAVKYDKPVIPLMLDDAPFSKSIEFDLSDIDRLDFRGVFEKKLLDNLAYEIGMNH